MCQQLRFNHGVIPHHTHLPTVVPCTGSVSVWHLDRDAAYPRAFICFSPLLLHAIPVVASSIVYEPSPAVFSRDLEVFAFVIVALSTYDLSSFFLFMFACRTAHRATDVGEKARIRHAGGKVVQGRVMGVLEPSRVIGVRPGVNIVKL